MNPKDWVEASIFLMGVVTSVAVLKTAQKFTNSQLEEVKVQVRSENQTRVEKIDKLTVLVYELKGSLE